MNKVKNPYTERTLIFAAVLVAVGSILSSTSRFISVEYLSIGLNITGAGIALLGATMLILITIMECKYGR